MASSLPDIPIEFMNPNKKYALMNYLVELGLPARIARGILQEWAASLNVQVDPSDYQLLQNHFKTVKVP
jgi:hypothetical protein